MLSVLPGRFASRCEQPCRLWHRLRSARWKSYRIAFFGSDHFSVDSLRVLNENRGQRSCIENVCKAEFLFQVAKQGATVVKSLHVVTPPDRPRGRGLQLHEGLFAFEDSIRMLSSLLVPAEDVAKSLHLPVYDAPMQRIMSDWKVRLYLW